MCCGLNSFSLHSDFQLIKFLFQVLRDWRKGLIYNWFDWRLRKGADLQVLSLTPSYSSAFLTVKVQIFSQNFTLLIFTHLRVCHISVNWWFHRGVWATQSPHFSKIFFNILADLINVFFGWSPLFLLFWSRPLSLNVIWWLYQVHQLYL